jgi:hypothetical protein
VLGSRFRQVKAHAHLLGLLGLTALTLGTLHGIAFQGQVLYERDIHLVWEAYSAAFVRAWRLGSWPLWDDALGFGQSLVANSAVQVFYPPTWLALALPFGARSTVYVVGHVLWSGAGFFTLGRRLGLVAPAAFFGAALWIVSGPFLSSVSLWHHFAGAAWIPWVLIGFLTLKQREDLGGIALGSLPVAGQILAGSADVCILTLALGTALVSTIEEGGPRPRLRALARVAAAILLAAALTAAAWATSLEALRQSGRADLGDAARTYWSLHPAGLLDLALPAQLAWWPLRPAARSALFESREPFLPSLYLGLSALPLVLVGLAHPRRRLVALFAGIGVAAVLVALGRHAPFYGALTSLVPPLKILRYPVKALFLVAFSWVSLAGLGVEVWLGGGLVKKRRWAALLAGLGAVLALAAALLPRAGGEWARPWLEPAPEANQTLLHLVARHLGLAAALLALAGLAAWRENKHLRRTAVVVIGSAAVLDLVVLVAPLNPTAPPEFYAYRPALFRAVMAGPPGRCYVYNYVAVVGKSEQHLGRATPIRPGRGVGPPSLLGGLALRSYMFPATAAAWGISYGFDVDMTGLASREVIRLHQLLWATEGTPAQLRLLQLGGVSQVVTLHDMRSEGLTPAGEFDEPLTDPVRLWRVPEPLPRVLVVGGERGADAVEALGLLADGTADPRREVVLAEGAPVEAPAGFRGAARVLEDRPGFLRVEATASHAGHLVVLDAHAPGWNARLDGRPVPILRANGVFRAIRLPPGFHSVEMRYLPASLSWGGGVSLGAALGMLALFVLRVASARSLTPS